MTDRFAMYDAAYLLGALTPQDRASFEAHLTECAECSGAVNQLAGMPGLLASASPDEMTVTAEDAPPLPDTLLPRLLAEVQRTRFRRRWTTITIGAAAAAVIAIAVAFGFNGSPSELFNHGQSDQTAAIRMHALIPHLPVHAKVRVSPEQWGTKLTIWCTYDAQTSGVHESPLMYTMVVTDKSGATQQIAAWEAYPGDPVVLDGATSVPTSEIASVQVRGPSGVPVLALDL
jgi:hypothetical protein